MIALIVVSRRLKVVQESAESSKVASDGGCSSKFAQNIALPKDPTVFQDLSVDELNSVRDYILKQKALNVKSHKSASVKDNVIFLIENYLPTKADILNHLDKNGQKPKRRARVVLLNGAKTIPNIEEYVVEPLPNPSSHTRLKLNGHKDSIPHYYRPWTALEQKGISKLYRRATEEAYQVLKESFDFWHHNCTDRCLLGLPIGVPGSAKKGLRQSWVIFTRNIVGQNLFPVPFLLLVNHRSPNPEKWEILQVVYNNQKFASTIDLVKKYNSDQVQKIKIPAPSEDLLERASLRKRGKNMPVTPSRGPAFVEPNGKRFSINGRKIKYMNWEFHVAVRSSAGPALFDVQFSGKRIAYEISVQEGVSYYSAHDPKESSAQYIDSGWGLGSFNMEMIKGIDCPETGVLMDSYHFMDTDKAFTNPDSICVFETNAGIPSRRHREFRFNKEGSAVEGFWFLGGMVDHALVVRVISTPFNYDYIFDFILHQNGIIEVKTSTAGYLQATFYTPKENDYGFHHFNNTIGTIHDHFILYKVDLDIAGVQNSYQTVDVVVKNKSYEWEPGTYRIKKTVVKDKKAKEKDALLRFNFAEPKYLVVINENQKNLYNNPVGYRIQPVSMVKEKYPDDYFATKAAAWTKYQLAVTEQKDDERFGSCLYNQFHMTDPACNFDTYVNDNDDIKNKDLVAWVTVGGLHIPNTEDIPTTNTNGNAYTFFLKPYGYFDEDPSMGSTNAMLIEKGKDGKIKIDTYDTPERSQCPVPSRKIEYKRG